MSVSGVVPQRRSQRRGGRPACIVANDSHSSDRSPHFIPGKRIALAFGPCATFDSVPACARFQPRPVREAVGAASCTPERRLGTRPPPCPREKPVHGGAAWALTSSGRAHSPSVGSLGYTIPPALPDRRAWRLHALERRPISCPALAPRGFQRAPACVMTPWPRCAASRTYPF